MKISDFRFQISKLAQGLVLLVSLMLVAELQAAPGVPILFYKAPVTGAAAGGGGWPYPADLVSGASNAWSFRLVTVSPRTTNAIRVRRTDNAELNIAWSGRTLDTNTMSTFGGTSNLFVTTVYDQIGTNDMVQTTAGTQPQIWNGSVFKTNSLGLVCWIYAGGQAVGTVEGPTGQSNWTYSAFTDSTVASPGDNVFFEKPTYNAGQASMHYAGQFSWYAAGTGMGTLAGANAYTGTNRHNTMVIATNGVTAVAVHQGTNVLTASIAGVANSFTNSLYLGARSGSGNFWSGCVWDVIGWKRALTDAEKMTVYQSGPSQ